MVAAETAIPTAWRSRIVGQGDEAPDQLLANPANWRIHPKAQQDALAGVLDRVGWVQRVIVNQRTGHIVDGHLRVELAISRGEASLPVSYVDLSEEEEALILASIDPLASMAVTDTAKLQELLASVAVDNVELERHLVTFYGSVNRSGIDPDDVPEPVTESYVNLGDLWLLGDHRILCGSAVEPEDVDRLLGRATPRLLVTDPPYGVRLDHRWRNGVFNKLGPAAHPYMQEQHGNRTLSGDTVVDWSAAFALVPSIEVAYVWHAGVHAAEVAMGLERIGLEIRSQIVWCKTTFAMSRGDYHWQHEPCWYAVRKGATAQWQGKHVDSTTWHLASPKHPMGGSQEDKFDHPAQKPIETMQRPVRNHAGDVYEPFSGSGTTIIAAEMERRRCYAMELEPRYVQVAIERWQTFTGRQAERIEAAGG